MNVKSFRTRIALVLLASCACIIAQQARAVTLDFSNLAHTSVNFSGGGFSFSSTNGYQFTITEVDGGTGDAVGLDGYVFAATPFTIGTIIPLGSGQTAPVTGSGTLHITDANNIDLTGTITWIDITTLGVGGILNLNGTVNLNGITYTDSGSGSSSDLAALGVAGAATDVITFQFAAAKTLTQLKSTGGSTSYSGSIDSVPEPGTITLVGMGLVSLLAFRHRRK